MIGCAGGVDIEASLSFNTLRKKVIYELCAKFKGGHSGINIIRNEKVPSKKWLIHTRK